MDRDDVVAPEPPAVSAAWRVEALAAEAGISVDTVRYYQKLGLLHPPERQGRVAN